MANQKTLFIVRHGKSNWDYENAADMDRPLNSRGINDAHTMAGRLYKRKIIPDLMLTSPAIRAFHTAIIFAMEINYPPDNIKIDRSVYHTYPEEIIKSIKKTDDSINSLMIFGHNPGFTELANFFTNEPISNVPTSGVVELVFNTNTWESIGKQNLQSEIFDYPKKHKHF